MRALPVPYSHVQHRRQPRKCPSMDELERKALEVQAALTDPKRLCPRCGGLGEAYDNDDAEFTDDTCFYCQGNYGPEDPDA